MLIKKLLGTGICTAALGYSAMGLHGADTVVHPLEAQRCADGSCVPRRLTNGFYATTWRRWPVDPPARAKPGVREGISAPSMELPSPRMETYLPEGTLIAPPPLQEGGADGNFDSGRPDPNPSVPSGPAPPRDDSPEGVPPELRSGQSRLPSNKRPPQRMPGIAGREITRPAAVMEALRSEATSHFDDAPAHRAASSIPEPLPSDARGLQPLPPPPAVETPSIKPKPRSIPTAHSLRWGDEPAAATKQTSQQGRTNWSPARRSHEVEPATAGLNAPAAIYASSLAEDVRRPASRADFSITASAPPAALAVRTVSEQSWSQSAHERNPLRSGSAVTKAAYEYSDLEPSDRPRESFSRTQKSSQSEALEVPANPLRK